MGIKLDEVINKLEKLSDLEILEVCTIILEEWGNGLIKENDKIFNPNDVGFRDNLVNTISACFYSIYRNFKEIRIPFPKNLLEIELTNKSLEVINSYRVLDFIDKIEMIEIIIRKYGNRTLFKDLQLDIPIMDNKTENDIADDIAKYRNNIKEGK